MAREARRARELASYLKSADQRETSVLYVQYEDLVSSPSRPRSRRGVAPVDADSQSQRFVPTSEALTQPIVRQAQGPLTGKVIYTSGGHGWTSDNTSTSLWFTQRPALLGMVEDFGNQDQLTVFTDAAFRAGATVVPLRPVGHQPVERVLDNTNGFHVKFQGAWSDTSSTIGFRLEGTLGTAYRFASASLTETAVARFRPKIPVQDYYPIYAFATAGVDRVPQTYRIVVGGGATEVVVDHRVVGGGWIYLGEYLLPAGDSSYVEVTNRVADKRFVGKGQVVIADAIRFGNGRGDTNRGGGISGRLREDEAALYWIGRAIPEQHREVAFWSESDNSSTIGAPPRMAAYMNRETAATKGQAVYLGWHSNAKPETSKPQRGALTLLTRAETSRTLLQVEWASQLVDSINQVMGSAKDLPVSWVVQPQRIVSFINYGEIRIDSINNEMPATIAEAAFHDDPDDVELLLDLRARRLMADGAVSGTVAFLRTVSGEKVPPADEILPPARPDFLSIQAQESSPGLVRLTYKIPSDGGRNTRVLVETGRLNQGLAYFAEAPASGEILDLGTSAPTMVRLVAEGPGGRSLPSRLMATGADETSSPRVLLVTAFDAEHRSQSLMAVEDGPFNFPTGKGGSYTRVMPRMINSQDQAAVVSRGLARWNLRFDSVHRSVFESLKPEELGKYSAVMYLEGRQQVPGYGLTKVTLEALNRASETLPVLVSGSALFRSRQGEDELRQGLAEWAGVRSVGTTSETAVLLLANSQPLTSGALTVSAGLPDGYLPVVLDAIQPRDGVTGQPWFFHQNDQQSLAGWIRKDAGKPLRAVLTAPLENLAPAVGRQAAVLYFLKEAGLLK